MKVSNHAEAAPQTLLPILAPKAGDAQAAAGTSKKDVSQIDPADPQGFSRLLPADPTDRADRSARNAAVDKSAASKKTSAADKTGTPSRKSLADKPQAGSRADRAAASAPSNSTAADSKDPAVAAPSGTPSASSSDSQDVTGGTLSPGSETLPPDPRLVQTPGELALEAAALAAVQALSAEPVVQAPVPDAAPALQVGDATGQGGAQSEAQQGAAVSFLDQLTLRTLQASFRPTLAAQPEQSAQPQAVQSAQVAPSVALPAAPVQSAPIGLELPKAAATVAPAISAPVEALAPLPLTASLVSLSATVAQAATLAASAKSQQSLSPVGSDNAEGRAVPSLQSLAALGGVANESVLASNFQTAASVQALQKNGASAEAPAAPIAQAPAINISGENFASQAVIVPDKTNLKPAETAPQPAQASSLGVQTVIVTGSQNSGADASGNGSSNSSGEQKAQDQTPSSPSIIPVKISALQNTRSSAALSKPMAQSGTLGATEQTVSKEASVVSLQPLDETAPAKSQDAVLNAFADKDSLAQVPVASGNAARPLSEVAMKPTVLPPVSVKGNEVWKVVSDALQRARSENPSHLAVEVRMEDGSTLGLEVRMSSTGLQASFRSESQTLLKTLEAQWAGFVAKEPSDSKVASATFESHAGLGNFGESSTNGGERRRQMEDASTSASLSRGTNAEKPAPAPGTVPKQITPSIRTRDGRMAVYA